MAVRETPVSVFREAVNDQSLFFFISSAFMSYILTWGEVTWVYRCVQIQSSTFNICALHCMEIIPQTKEKRIKKHFDLS